jgi:NADH-quinone oxidoreductase subunit J
MIPLLFAAFAAVLVVSSLLVILHKNPVTSALFLVLAFCSLAALYLLLGAEFVGMVQIIVYAGAIMVLFLFVIMYLNLGHDVEAGVQIALRRGLGWVVGAVLVVEGAMLLSRGMALGPVTPQSPPPPGGNTGAIGLLLYSRYLFPFEITSLVLLVAMVGAIVITRGRATATGPARAARAAAPRAATPAVPAPAAPAAGPAGTPAEEIHA